MKATHENQLQLLDLQKLDQRESRLRHQRDSHPAHETVRELAARADDLRRAAVSQAAVIADCERETQRLEDERTKVAERRVRQQGRIERNEVPLRDINPMQHEIAQMDQRLSVLENDQLAAEEKLEAAREAQDAMVREGDAIVADVEKTKVQFLEDPAAIDAELREVLAERRALAAALPSDLVEEYERARTRNGALAVLEVRDGNPMGAATDLSPLELESIRLTPADELYWTEDTGQIVVRTSN